MWTTCRLDVSSLGLKGSLSCPNDTLYASWPPPPPPLPKPCVQGPDPRRGCPHYDWFWSNTAVGLFPKPGLHYTMTFRALSTVREILHGASVQ